MVNILLVEDNAINQFIAVKFLKLWGMSVRVENHGLEALALVGSKSFHLILMDLDMPEMDGYESTRRIREMEGGYFKTIPIIAFSASDILDARGKAIDCGMTDLVSKPLQQDELQSTIDKYVRQGSDEVGLRPLDIDFHQYTDGDADFKRELVSLMVNDIAEMQKSVMQALDMNNPDLFLRALHKSKTTINMVNDSEMVLLLEDLKSCAVEGNKGDACSEDKILRFDKLCDDVCKSLSSLNQANSQYDRQRAADLVV